VAAPAPEPPLTTRWAVLALAGVAAFFVSFDGYVMVLALPAIASDFHASVPAIADVASIFGLGTIVGLPIAMLADRLGRRRLLAVAVAGFSLANLASAAAPGLWWLAGIRAAAVTFETVAASIATALVIEEVEARWRGLAVAGIAIAAGAGVGLTTVLYPLVAPHWRWLYLLGAPGLIVALALARWLPESRTWAATLHERLPIAVLLGPPWRARLLLLAGSAALGAILYEPAGLLVALFGSQRLGLAPPVISAVVVVSGLATVPAFLVGGRLSDQWGRRRLAAGLTLMTAVFAAGTFAGVTAFYWIGNVLWSLLASASVPVIGAWSGELFPTRARATSEAAAALAAGVGGIAGLQLVGLLQPRFGLGASVALAGCAAIVGAALLLFLPETAGDPLPP
jgi:MFS transporter, DHA1 family, inner membrane transport protein